MRINAAVRRRQRLSLTSLIDVIFLLLLFFMLSSTFTRFAEVELAGGQGGTGTSGQPDILIRLDGEAWTVNGETVEPEGAIAQLQGLEAAGAESAVLLVRGEATSQQLVTAVEQIRRDTTLTLNVAR
ncbi:biopolymer transporter ExbD [Pararhizobium haloflavum]|uniref:biopolymer transporter ExbD n=1 Tax=Pararhizobium haloflavum TaxID=2037914 RepID=UPI000C17D7E9|nr:biopolymer transporter ExbD [Pararhizobium haloflavum]